jgi:hypothetical protein
MFLCTLTITKSGHQLNPGISKKLNKTHYNAATITMKSTYKLQHPFHPIMLPRTRAYLTPTYIPGSDLPPTRSFDTIQFNEEHLLAPLWNECIYTLKLQAPSERPRPQPSNLHMMVGRPPKLPNQQILTPTLQFTNFTLHLHIHPQPPGQTRRLLPSIVWEDKSNVVINSMVGFQSFQIKI